MKDALSALVSLYSVSLCAFLIFIRKGFLHMSGESSMPSIDINCFDDSGDEE